MAIYEVNAINLLAGNVLKHYIRTEGQEDEWKNWRKDGLPNTKATPIPSIPNLFITEITLPSINNKISTNDQL